MHEIEDQTKFYNSKAENTGWRDFIGSDFINHLSFQASRLPNFGISLTAFTMAEILISLTIIGIIAAITLPSLRANINEKTWTTQRKALYSRLSQAISMMPSLNGYGIVINTDGTVNKSETANKATQAFITDGLSKVLKINNICDDKNLSKHKCNFPYNNIKTFNGSTINIPSDFYSMYSSIAYVSQNYINTKLVAFETANGESGLAYYNPNCNYFDKNSIIDAFHNDDNINNILPSLCVNFIFDVNGKKGPNKVGKDISYITVLSPTDSIVSFVIPHGDVKSLTYNEGVQYCRELGSDYRLPTIYDLISIYANIKIIYGIEYNRYWTSTIDKNSKPLTLYMARGHIRSMTKTLEYRVQCVER